MAGENWLSRLTRLARRRTYERELAEQAERDKQAAALLSQFGALNKEASDNSKALFGPPKTKHIAGPERTKSSKDDD